MRRGGSFALRHRRDVAPPGSPLRRGALRRRARLGAGAARAGRDRPVRAAGPARRRSSRSTSSGTRRSSSGASRSTRPGSPGRPMRARVDLLHTLASPIPLLWRGASAHDRARRDALAPPRRGRRRDALVREAALPAGARPRRRRSSRRPSPRGTTSSAPPARRATGSSSSRTASTRSSSRPAREGGTARAVPARRRDLRAAQEPARAARGAAAAAARRTRPRRSSSRAGRRGRTRCRSGDVAPHVRLAGMVSDEELAALYAGAGVLRHPVPARGVRRSRSPRRWRRARPPSRATSPRCARSGARRCGTRTRTTPRASPTAVRQALDDREGSQLRAAAARGRARRFRWEDAARATLAVYRRALRARRR